MSLDQPPQNKMMTEAPRQKAGWHFPSDGIYKALYVWARTIEEAEAIYHKTKERIVSADSSVAPAPQSTAPTETEITE